MKRDKRLERIAVALLETLAVIARSGRFGRVVAKEEYHRYRDELEALGVVKPEPTPDHYGCQPIPEP